MLGLFDFFKSGKLIYFIICLIGLYTALRFVFMYYVPTGLNFINMYFMHSILVYLTIFFSVPLNSNVNMSDIQTAIEVNPFENASAPPKSDLEAPIASETVSANFPTSAGISKPFELSNTASAIEVNPFENASAPPKSDLEAPIASETVSANFPTSAGISNLPFELSNPASATSIPPTAPIAYETVSNSLASLQPSS